MPGSDSCAAGRRRAAAIPMYLALLAVGIVWLLGCAWSFEEQTAFATAKQFAFPHLLPLVIDGFAVAMAGVAWAASLDARPAVAARLATLVAVAGSATSNGAWAWIRSQHDLATVVIAAAVPIAANVAFEVLLAELRRQVQRRRGQPAPAAIPRPRLIRFALAPRRTWAEWRAVVLALTAPLAPSSSDLTGISTCAPTELPPGKPDIGSAALPESPAPQIPEEAPITPPADGTGIDRRPNPIPSASYAPRPTIGDRPLDDRAIILAAKLAKLDDPDAVTGDAVSELLGIQLAPRTGRRLLGQARALRSTDLANVGATGS